MCLNEIDSYPPPKPVQGTNAIMLAKPDTSGYGTVPDTDETTAVPGATKVTMMSRKTTVSIFYIYRCLAALVFERMCSCGMSLMFNAYAIKKTYESQFNVSLWFGTGVTAMGRCACRRHLSWVPALHDILLGLTTLLIVMLLLRGPGGFSYSSHAIVFFLL